VVSFFLVTYALVAFALIFSVAFLLSVVIIFKFILLSCLKRQCQSFRIYEFPFSVVNHLSPVFRLLYSSYLTHFIVCPFFTLFLKSSGQKPFKTCHFSVNFCTFLVTFCHFSFIFRSFLTVIWVILNDCNDYINLPPLIITQKQTLKPN